ncbi:MAG: hypothetical protein ACYSWX_00175 [Planctomycetota bacterium]
MSLDRQFQDYFAALERAGGEDRCFLCRRTPADVKAFFGFHEDGTPIEQEEYGLEDVVLKALDIMSYRGTRPVCAVCQLNVDSIELSGERPVLRKLIDEMAAERDRLWPPPGHERKD